MEDPFHQQLSLFELTVPFERNIETRHTEKTNKYAYFVSDITFYETFLCAFEIGNRGYISSSNQHSLLRIHKFVKPGINLGKFKENISALSVYSSYHIFLCRKEPVWAEPPLLMPPYDDKRNPEALIIHPVQSQCCGLQL